jgi:hypothetical protein
VRILWLLALNIGCAFISDEHAAWRTDPDGDGLSWGADCDGGDADSSKPSIWYLDDDGDGYGDEASTVDACGQPDGYVAVTGDCDDGDAAVMPGVVVGATPTMMIAMVMWMRTLFLASGFWIRMGTALVTRVTS